MGNKHESMSVSIPSCILTFQSNYKGRAHFRDVAAPGLRRIRAACARTVQVGCNYVKNQKQSPTAAATMMMMTMMMMMLAGS